MTCHTSCDGTLTICMPGRTREVSRKPAGVKWCFACRKHLPHDFIVIDEIEPSYYDPWCRYDCPKCHQDNTLGFGMVREWDYA